VTPIRWGVLGAAKIAKARTIPALQSSARSQVVAIASRDLGTAQAAAAECGIPRAHGSYDALLADKDVDAVYIPLPNHLHVPWTTRAARAGKHVLCEKPIALTASEARELLHVRDETGVQIVEAFMVRSHPRWHAAKHVVESGRIGSLRTIAAHFSYARKGGENIRSKVEWGGGAILDIGCYPVMMSRWMFGCEPLEVMCTIDRDAEFGIDALASAILRFPTGLATFTCSGELALRQSMQLMGTTGFIDIPVPFNPSETLPTELVLDDGRDLAGSGAQRIAFSVVNQFAAQGDAFADAVEGRAGVAVTLEDSIANMAVLDALFRSGASGRWERPAES